MGTQWRFDDRVVLVTGASRGLGRAIARHIAGLGATVVINSLGSRDDAQLPSAARQVQDEIESEGGRARVFDCAVEQGERIVEFCERELGRLDAIVHSAGILRDATLAKLTPEDWQAVQRVHLEAAYRLCRAAWAGFKARGRGRLVFMSSASGLYGSFGQSAYSAAKLGLWGLARTLALEGERSDIRCNCIAPVGLTRMNAAILTGPQRTRYGAEAIAPLAAWLCHERCTDTGELFEAMGGWFAQVRIERSQGVVLDPGQLTIDAIAGARAAIGDFTRTEAPRTMAESMALIDARTGVQR
jgi:3-hydroxyacyl-CoA dehydrogenase/3a,7a,12a-trihydroxy-5b-cholest-24-enoyl-CoA hydratase